tara:strand:- start:2046 stop:2261 length:216 start_codon:yes stop_codon:yes gene_type:complete
MIASPNIIQYNSLKREYLKLGTFIRSLYRHTELEDCMEYDILRAELDSLSNRLDKITTEMDAFEQINLGMK